VTDFSLRLPNSTFRAVLDLGPLPLNAPPLPESLSNPDLDADLDDESGSSALFIGYESGQLHLEVNAQSLVEYHFHAPGDEGDGSETSPWGADDTTTLLAWAYFFCERVMPMLPDLFSDAEEAADWHHEGLTVYARDYGAVPLEIIEVEMEGELFMLPWLGAGHYDHVHLDGPNDPIALVWDRDSENPDTAIARAWLDPITELPRSEAVRGVDWTEVGMPQAEVLSWFEGFYLNHHVIADPALLIVQAALRRIAGLDELPSEF